MPVSKQIHLKLGTSASFLRSVSSQLQCSMSLIKNHQEVVAEEEEAVAVAVAIEEEALVEAEIVADVEGSLAGAETAVAVVEDEGFLLAAAEAAVVVSKMAVALRRDSKFVLRNFFSRDSSIYSEQCMESYIFLNDLKSYKLFSFSFAVMSPLLRSPPWRREANDAVCEGCGNFDSVSFFTFSASAADAALLGGAGTFKKDFNNPKLD